MFCQLETLQRCLPQSVLRTLNELPDSLDDTYERVMKEIKRPTNRTRIECFNASRWRFGPFKSPSLRNYSRSILMWRRARFRSLTRSGGGKTMKRQYSRPAQV